jgi:hypothetical protein
MYVNSARYYQAYEDKFPVWGTTDPTTHPTHAVAFEEMLADAEREAQFLDQKITRLEEEIATTRMNRQVAQKKADGLERLIADMRQVKEGATAPFVIMSEAREPVEPISRKPARSGRMGRSILFATVLAFLVVGGVLIYGTANGGGDISSAAARLLGMHISSM